jgi:hypothetical protein
MNKFCDLNKSINVGFYSSIILMILTYIILPQIKQLDYTKLLFLFVVFFVISTSMDYFNYCYTECKSVTSSLKYGLFTVSLIYLFLTLFLKPLDNKIFMNNNEIVSIGLNILFLTGLHYYLCDIRNV